MAHVHVCTKGTLKEQKSLLRPEDSAKRTPQTAFASEFQNLSFRIRRISIRHAQIVSSLGGCAARRFTGFSFRGADVVHRSGFAACYGTIKSLFSSMRCLFAIAGS